MIRGWFADDAKAVHSVVPDAVSMTTDQPDSPAAPTAATEPIPPTEGAASPPAGSTPPPPPFQPAPPAGPAEAPASRTPWYRRAWVLAAGAVLLAVLSFGSGCIAGGATSLAQTLSSPVQGGMPGGHGGPGFGDSSDRGGPGFGERGDRGDRGDRGSQSGQGEMRTEQGDED